MAESAYSRLSPAARENAKRCSRERYWANRDAILASKRDDPRKTYKRWVRTLRDSYGMTEQDYYDLLDSQDGGCAICGVRHEHRMPVDHDHATGRVRGILCQKCNISLGGLGDNEAGLLRALGYLRAKA